jgi:hypothetical protein
MVGKIATGEVQEEVAYATTPKRGSAGGKARARRLSTGERQEIAKAGAKARWTERRHEMTEQGRLMRALFEHQGREHMDIKFLRGQSPKSTTEDICREANKAIFQIDNGLVEGDTEFEEHFKQVDVVELVSTL